MSKEIINPFYGNDASKTITPDSNCQSFAILNEGAADFTVTVTEVDGDTKVIKVRSQTGFEGVFNPISAILITNASQSNFSGVLYKDEIDNPKGYFKFGETPALGTVGTASSGITASEEGFAGYHKTTLTVPEFTQAIAGAALGFGKELYSFPEGLVKVKYATVDLTISGATETGTPDVGIGTVVASGEIDALNGTATFEDIMDGFTATAITSEGSVSNNYVAAEAGLLDGHTTAKKAFLNFAETWTATEDLTISATVTLFWDNLGDY